MLMIPRVVSVWTTGPHRLRVTFDDGVAGELDFSRFLRFEGVLAPLREPAYFAQVSVDPESGTLVWPNGVDLDPLVLHSRVTGKPVHLDGVPPASEQCAMMYG